MQVTTTPTLNDHVQGAARTALLPAAVVGGVVGLQGLLQDGARGAARPALSFGGATLAGVFAASLTGRALDAHEDTGLARIGSAAVQGAAAGTAALGAFTLLASGVGSTRDLVATALLGTVAGAGAGAIAGLFATD